jgi:hypothetical protein
MVSRQKWHLSALLKRLTGYFGLGMQVHSYQCSCSTVHVDLTCLLGSDADVGERAWDLSTDDEMNVHQNTLQHFLVLYSPGETPSILRNLSKHKGATLHFELPMAERRHVLCVGVGGDRTHAGPLQKSGVCPP